jgi:hypothetical protein
VFGNRSKKTRERLEAHGVRATATVLEISGGHVSVTTGNPQLAANTELPMKLRLRVEPQGQDPFEVETKMTFPQLGLPRQGGSIAVIFDPDDHDTVIRDQTTAGGFSMAADSIRARAEETDRPELDAVADIVERASSGGGIDVEAMQRQIREQFAPGGAAAPDLSAFFPTAARPEDPVDKLAKLAELKEKGLLTEEEFNSQKARILGED